MEQCRPDGEAVGARPRQIRDAQRRAAPSHEEDRRERVGDGGGTVESQHHSEEQHQPHTEARAEQPDPQERPFRQGTTEEAHVGQNGR